MVYSHRASAGQDQEWDKDQYNAKIRVQVRYSLSCSEKTSTNVMQANFVPVPVPVSVLLPLKLCVNRPLVLEALFTRSVFQPVFVGGTFDPFNVMRKHLHWILLNPRKPHGYPPTLARTGIPPPPPKGPETWERT